MTILTLVIILAAMGFGLYLLNAHAPIDGNIKKIINVVVIVAAVIFAASAFGVCR